MLRLGRQMRTLKYCVPRSGNSYRNIRLNSYSSIQKYRLHTEKLHNDNWYTVGNELSIFDAL